MKVLVTGATGYVGGRLVPRLLGAGHEVRVLVRDLDRIRGRSWVGQVRTVEGDLRNAHAAERALAGIDVAYYLVHSMGGKGDFEELERKTAESFVGAGKGLRHVIFLGGLLPDGERISKHLRSRAEVGRILREGLPATEFRAGPIIGSGSASFEMVRYLTERLPIMIAPKWVRNPVRPIAVRDMLAYLLQALERPPLGIVDVGAEPVAFIQMMQEYASVRGYRRWILPVPVLAPGLAARWVGLVTPITNRLAVPLVRGMIAPLVGDTAKAREAFPSIRPMAYRDAVQLATQSTDEGNVETRWTGALSESTTFDTEDWEGTIRETRSVMTTASPELLFATFSSLGGEKGWLFWDWAWGMRGFVDKIFGGPGLRRGRRHAHELFPGEALDFWRVETVTPNKALRLRAEMKVPGKARLQWEAVPETDGTRLVQTALFAPDGLPGTLYWYLLYPMHYVMFSGLIRAVAKEAERASTQATAVRARRRGTTPPS